MKKRMPSLLLAALLLVPLVSCSNNVSDSSETKEASDTETAASASSDESVETEAETDPLAELYADLPTGNYDGYDFVMLNNESNFAYTFMTAEELTGDGLNDAVYNRNIKVADKLGINISENLVGYNDVTTTMNTEIASNTDTYACFWNESKFVAPFAMKGSLVNVNGIDALNLEKPWWNSGAMNDVEVKDNLYFLVGDLHLMFKESYWIVGFNKSIMDQNNLGDTYELVREGKWTFDTMVEYMATAARDLNGNGKVDASDQFGAVSYSGCVKPLLFASGETLMEKNAEGVPEIKTPGDRFYTVYADIVNSFYGDNNYFCDSYNTPGVSSYSEGWVGVFSQGHAMFFFDQVGSLKKLRDMDVEFGVLPYPKYEESQENYVSLISEYAAFCGIPVSNGDTERTGVILENLCAESYGGVRDAYNKATLNFKYIRDEDSAEMLNLVFDTGVFNLADALGITTIGDLLKSNASNGNPDIASSYAKVLKPSTKLLDKSIAGMLGE